MAADAEDAFLESYRDELTYLRRMGLKFAKSHPRIGKRLQLGEGVSPDPHVERLLEGFAFLTARIQNNLKAEIPEITTGLLGYLYPHFASPVPAMSIASLTPDDGGAGLTTGLKVPRGTKLFTETSFQKRTCRFRTCYPVTLWPLVVEGVKFKSPNAYEFLKFGHYLPTRTVLEVKLKSNSDAIGELKPDKLNFYIHGQPNVTGALFELMQTGLTDVVCLPNGDQPAPDAELKNCPVRWMGYTAEEAVLPTQGHGLRGYSLLQEYFSMPEKFLFFEVDQLVTEGAGETLTLLFLFDEEPRSKISVAKDTLRLGCTPVINLFNKVTEPIHLKGLKAEHLIIPDNRWERTTEIHSIRGITPSITFDEHTECLQPLYGLGHSDEKNVIYWHMKRRPSRVSGIPGTDAWIGFVDADLRPRVPEYRTLRVHAVCTNRDLATHLDQGDSLMIEDGPHCLIELLKRPTAPLSPPTAGESRWRLISHLSLSHLALPESSNLTEALREQLRVYAFTSADSIEPQLRGIENVRREAVALRADDNAWRGFARVQRITVTVDERLFGGLSPMVLGNVLHHYFGLHSSVNVFTQLAMESRQREGVWNTWPPMIPKIGT